VVGEDANHGICQILKILESLNPDSNPCVTDETILNLSACYPVTLLPCHPVTLSPDISERRDLRLPPQVMVEGDAFA
jgi:hypothetical protein